MDLWLSIAMALVAAVALAILVYDAQNDVGD
jgi:hypothetical protein